MELTIGSKAPEFKLQASNVNEDVSLSNYQGRYVILFFYPKDDTPGCTKEVCSFRDNYESITALHNTAVLGISADDLESHNLFSAKFQLPFPLLTDTDHLISTVYGTWREKKFLGKAVWSIMRTTFIIDPLGDIVHIFDNVNPETHIQSVMETLEQLQSNHLE